jgi:hypothetical protein
MSRDGMRNALVPVTTATAVLLLLRWADIPTRGTAVAAGIAAGAGLWTYQPLKLLPLLVLLWLLWLRHADAGRHAAMAAQCGWVAAAYAVVALPMAAVAAGNPAAYFGRGLQTSPLNPDNGGGGAFEHIVGVAGMFTVSGDPNARHNAAGLAMLGWPLGLIALAGVLRAWRSRNAVPAASLLLLGAAVFVIPPLAAVEGGTPHFLRSLGLAPFVAGFVGLGCVEVVRIAGVLGGLPHARRLAAAACALTMVGTVAIGLSAYARRDSSAWWYAYSADTVQMARAATTRDTVISPDYSAMTVSFIDHGHLPIVVRPSVAVHPAPGTTVFATNRRDLEDALGADVRIRVALTDPDGRPDVYAVDR